MKQLNRAWNKTRTVQYFMDLYNRATIQGAVEIAAQREREILLTGFQDYCRIPVDVESIAKRKGIRFGSVLTKFEDGDASMVLMNGEARLQLNPDRTNFRKRLTIAHEIGHMLFHHGKEHQIGVLDRREMQAEEIICFMFARALLMPTEHVRKCIQQIPNGMPLEILAELERARREFEVSLPVLILRIGEVKGMSAFPCIFLYFRYRENRCTRSDPQLRLDICSSIGELSHLRAWPNRSAKGLNFLSAEALFASWKSRLGGGTEQTGGRYVLNADGGIARATREFIKWTPENLHFSVLKRGKWRNEVIPVRTVSFLYVRKGWDEKEAYVISIIKSLR